MYVVILIKVTFLKKKNQTQLDVKNYQDIAIFNKCHKIEYLESNVWLDNGKNTLSIRQMVKIRKSHNLVILYFSFSFKLYIF